MSETSSFQYYQPGSLKKAGPGHDGLRFIIKPI
jgi:hypothetical protein